MPQNDTKRLISGRFITPIRHLENRGGWPRIFLKNEEFKQAQKLKTKPLTNELYNSPKPGSGTGSPNMPQNDTKRLINGRFITPIRHLENRGGWPRIFLKKMKSLNKPKIKEKTPNKWSIQPTKTWLWGGVSKCAKKLRKTPNKWPIYRPNQTSGKSWGLT